MNASDQKSNMPFLSNEFFMTLFTKRTHMNDQTKNLK